MLRNDEPAAAMKEIKMVAREIDKVDLSLNEQAVEIALIRDYEADRMCEIDNQSADFRYLAFFTDVYRAARQNGGNVAAIIHRTRSIKRQFAASDDVRKRNGRDRWQVGRAFLPGRELVLRQLTSRYLKISRYIVSNDRIPPERLDALPRSLP